MPASKRQIAGSDDLALAAVQRARCRPPMGLFEPGTAGWTRHRRAVTGTALGMLLAVATYGVLSAASALTARDGAATRNPSGSEPPGGSPTQP